MKNQREHHLVSGDRLVTLGRVQAVGELNGVLVVGGKLAVLPGVLDGGQDGAAREAAVESQVGSRVLGVVAATLLVEDTGIRGVPEVAVGQLGGRPLAEAVASLLGNQVEDVGTDIPAAQGVEAPVGFDGGDLTVVVVEVVVGGADKVLGEGVTEQDGENLVALGVGLVLIPGEEDKSVVHEVLVVEEGLEESTAPLASNTDVGVVTVRGHVGGDEHPLGQLVLLEVLVEHGAAGVNHGQVLDLGQTLLVVGDAAGQNGGVVLADVVVGTGLGVDVAEALVAGVGLVLLVVAPRDATVLEQVDDGRHVEVGRVEIIILHAKVVTGNSRHVVGLGRMSDTIVVGQLDTLLGEPGEVGCRCC